MAIANTRVCFEVQAHLLYIPAFDTRRISTMQDPNGSLPGATTPTSPRTPKSRTHASSNLPRPHLKPPRVHNRTLTTNEHTCPSPQRTKKDLW